MHKHLSLLIRLDGHRLRFDNPWSLFISFINVNNLNVIFREFKWRLSWCSESLPRHSLSSEMWGRASNSTWRDNWLKMLRPNGDSSYPWFWLQLTTAWLPRRWKWWGKGGLRLEKTSVPALCLVCHGRSPGRPLCLGNYRCHWRCYSVWLVLHVEVLSRTEGRVGGRYWIVLHIGLLS